MWHDWHILLSRKQGSWFFSTCQWCVSFCRNSHQPTTEQIVISRCCQYGDAVTRRWLEGMPWVLPFFCSRCTSVDFCTGQLWICWLLVHSFSQNSLFIGLLCWFKVSFFFLKPSLFQTMESAGEPQSVQFRRATFIFPNESVLTEELLLSRQPKMLGCDCLQHKVYDLDEKIAPLPKLTYTQNPIGFALSLECKCFFFFNNLCVKTKHKRKHSFSLLFRRRDKTLSLLLLKTENFNKNEMCLQRNKGSATGWE